MEIKELSIKSNFMAVLQFLIENDDICEGRCC